MSGKPSIGDKFAAFGSGPRSKNMFDMYGNPDVPTNEPVIEPTNVEPNVPVNEPANIPANEPVHVQTNEPTIVPTNEEANVQINKPTNVPTNERTYVRKNVQNNVQKNKRINKPTYVGMSGGISMRELLLNNDGKNLRATTVRMPDEMHVELGVYKSHSHRTGDDIITEAIALYFDLLNNQEIKKRLAATDGDVYDAVMAAVRK